MTTTYDAVVIGGGHNGLVAAAYLGKAGMRVLVLERRHVLGGAAGTEDGLPGFRVSVASYVVSLDPLRLDPRQWLPLRPLWRSFRALPPDERVAFVQLMTQSAVDFISQWFETDELIGTMSSWGIIGTFLGIRSPGTAYVMLHHYMGEVDGAFGAWGVQRGGTAASPGVTARWVGPLVRARGSGPAPYCGTPTPAGRSSAWSSRNS